MAAIVGLLTINISQQQLAINAEGHACTVKQCILPGRPTGTASPYASGCKLCDFVYLYIFTDGYDLITSNTCCSVTRSNTVLRLIDQLTARLPLNKAPCQVLQRVTSRRGNSEYTLDSCKSLPATSAS